MKEIFSFSVDMTTVSWNAPNVYVMHSQVIFIILSLAWEKFSEGQKLQLDTFTSRLRLLEQLSSHLQPMCLCTSERDWPTRLAYSSCRWTQSCHIQRSALAVKSWFIHPYILIIMIQS